MAELFKIDITEMAKDVAEKVLDEILYDGRSIREWMQIIAQEDCISRQSVLDATVKKNNIWNSITNSKGENLEEIISQLSPPVRPQERTGHWIRMSDLSEQEDDRYKCSYCGNVIHHKNKMDLYTFNSWCGRCGSDNGRRTG